MGEYKSIGQLNRRLAVRKFANKFTSPAQRTAAKTTAVKVGKYAWSLTLQGAKNANRNVRRDYKHHDFDYDVKYGGY